MTGLYSYRKVTDIENKTDMTYLEYEKRIFLDIRKLGYPLLRLNILNIIFIISNIGSFNISVKTVGCIP
jgi:hypothetical protein